MKKRFALAVVTIFLIISGAIFVLAERAHVQLEQIVSQQFNEQQLILARKIADDIRKHFVVLDAALLNLGRRQFAEGEMRRHDTASITEAFAILKHWGVLGVSFFHPDRQDDAMVYTETSWMHLQELDIRLPEEPASTGEELFSGQIALSRTQQPSSGPFAGRWVMSMTHKPSQPGQNVVTAPEHGQIILFILDAQRIAGSAAQGVRSGKTGYAWVIDHKGYFMYHVEPDFDGQNSLTIRHDRNPHISYARLNSLVENHLLKGEEGTDWYISGWHWEIIREMKKLFAFSPIILASENGEPTHVWSVGLAAPDTEVYGLIQPVVVRQWLIVGLFFAAVIIAFAGFLFISLRWSETLRREVNKKTEHIRRSEEALRHERDKVKASMDQLIHTQERLVISERFAAIGEAAAHLSHEIKNPLMLMGGFANQVLRTLPGEDERSEKLRIIAGEAKRLEHLLLEVRDFTRPPQPQFSEGSLNDLVQDVAQLFEEQITEHKVVCRLELDPLLPGLCFDAGQIKQVLLNLVKNALEVMPDGGELVLSTRGEDNQIKLIIADTGPGITPEVMKKLFHPFFSTKPKGTGLGLAVSYKIIQDHGGDIVVQSRAGQGTRFIITLPLDQATVGPGEPQQE